MGNLKINMADVKVSSFEAIPKGWYHTRVTGWTLETTKSGPNEGANYINFELTVQDGEYEDRKLWVNASLLPHALFTLKNLTDASGLDSSGDIDADDLADQLVGQEQMSRVIVKPYEGDDKNEVKGFKKVGDASASGSAASASGGSLLP
jgi:hypothetical protein